MMKLAWRIRNDSECLLTKVILHKYAWSASSALEPVAKPYSSATWKAICLHWSDVSLNSTWSIGNGRSVRLWENNWFPTLGPLLPITIKDVPSTLCSRSTESFVMSTRQWNWTILQEFLPAHTCLIIARLPLPSRTDDRDNLVWNLSLSGVFTLKSALPIINLAGLDDPDKLWILIWRLKVPKRVKSFLWLVAHDRLPTSSHCRKCQVIPSDVCERCRDGEETTMHALRDCLYAKTI